MESKHPPKRKHRTFEDRVAEFDGEYIFTEWGTGEPVGKERFWEEDSERMKKEYDFSNEEKPPFFTEANQARLQKAMEQLEVGKGTARDLIETDEEPE